MKKSFTRGAMLAAFAALTAFVPAGNCAVSFAADMPAPAAADLQTPPVASNLTIKTNSDKRVWLQCNIKTPANVMDAITYFYEKDSEEHPAGFISNLEMQYSVNGGEWVDTGLNYAPIFDGTKKASENSADAKANALSVWNGVFETGFLSDIQPDSFVKARVRYVGADAAGEPVYSEWSQEFAVNAGEKFDASEWAQGELFAANSLGIVPASLAKSDLTKPVTRAEFAGIVVKGYETMSGKTAEAAKNDPFTDTDNADVLKAYALDITSGTSATTFEPDALLTREQAATMLTRMYKKAKYEGWTSATDADFSAVFLDSFTMPSAFADDAQISPWAKDSVYFLKAKDVLDGVGDNNFAPKATTDEQAAAGYGNTSREQALIIAKRMIEKLK